MKRLQSIVFASVLTAALAPSAFGGTTSGVITMQRASGTITMQRASGIITMQRASGTITMQRASGTITMQRASAETRLNFRAMTMVDYFYLILTSVMM